MFSAKAPPLYDLNKEEKAGRGEDHCRGVAFQITDTSNVIIVNT